MEDMHVTAAFDQIEGMTEAEVENWVRPWVHSPDGWVSSANRAVSYAACAMQAEGYPNRDIARIVARMVNAIPGCDV